MFHRRIKLFPLFKDVKISPVPILFFNLIFVDNVANGRAMLKPEMVDLSYDNSWLPPELVQVSPGRKDHLPEWTASAPESLLKFYATDGWPLSTPSCIINGVFTVEFKIDYKICNLT